METTANFGFKKASGADKAADALQWLNDNWDLLDGLGIVTLSGSNSQLYYEQWSNGRAHISGCIDLGTSYPCSYGIAHGMYSSSPYTLNLPIALADDKYSLVACVAADVNPDMSVGVTSKSTTTAKVYFINGVDDASAPNSKQLSVEIWGRWK